MMSVEELRAHVAAHVPDAGLTVEGAVLVVAGKDLLGVATFLRDDARTKLDFLTNLCASDFLAKGDKPGYLEVVYHLYSVALRHGPVVLKARTADRGANAHLPSVTPVWRGAELQEREAFDLYGVVFDGHPDLRRILTWDEMEDFPMRKDYQPPEDNEWEPTPHGALVDKLKARGEAQ